MKLSHAGLVLAAVLSIAVVAFSQAPDFSKVEITTQKIAEGLYVLQGTGGNIGVSVGADAVFLVDDQYAPLTPKSRPRWRPSPTPQPGSFASTRTTPLAVMNAIVLPAFGTSTPPN